MVSKYAEDIGQLKTDVEVIRAIATERKVVTKEWRNAVDHKLDTIIANGKAYATLDALSKTMESHAASCPARQSGGRKALDTAKEHWPVLTTVIGLAVTLGACLKVALDMLAPFLAGG